MVHTVVAKQIKQDPKAKQIQGFVVNPDLFLKIFIIKTNKGKAGNHHWFETMSFSVFPLKLIK